MKQTSLLMALCVLFSFSAIAQSAAPADPNTKRITITTTKKDETGKTVFETWIAEGTEPAKILEEMAIHPEVMQKVELEGTPGASGGERLFLFRSAGNHVAVEGTLDEQADPGQIKEIIVIRQDGDAPQVTTKISNWHDKAHGAKGYAYGRRHSEKINCAALGVWTHSYGEQAGARINGLIENGGAKQAGLQEGDVIRKIEEFDVSDFGTLHLALSHFQPGDQVTVNYDREGKLLKAKVPLKDWAELPGHEWRSRGDCGKTGLEDLKETDPIVLDDPSFVRTLQPLVLEDARIYPNPTDGVFAFSFTTEPGPVTISISDINGKVVYQEDNDNGSGSYNRDIDLKGLPQGNYIISVNQKDKVFTQQISKQ